MHEARDRFNASGSRGTPNISKYSVYVGFCQDIFFFIVALCKRQKGSKPKNHTATVPQSLFGRWLLLLPEFFTRKNVHLTRLSHLGSARRAAAKRHYFQTRLSFFLRPRQEATAKQACLCFCNSVQANNNVINILFSWLESEDKWDNLHT